MLSIYKLPSFFTALRKPPSKPVAGGAPAGAPGIVSEFAFGAARVLALASVDVFASAAGFALSSVNICFL